MVNAMPSARSSPTSAARSVFRRTRGDEGAWGGVAGSTTVTAFAPDPGRASSAAYDCAQGGDPVPEGLELLGLGGGARREAGEAVDLGLRVLDLDLGGADLPGDEILDLAVLAVDAVRRGDQLVPDGVCQVRRAWGSPSWTVTVTRVEWGGASAFTRWRNSST